MRGSELRDDTALSNIVMEWLGSLNHRHHMHHSQQQQSSTCVPYVWSLFITQQGSVYDLIEKKKERLLARSFMSHQTNSGGTDICARMFHRDRASQNSVGKQRREVDQSRAERTQSCNFPVEYADAMRCDAS
ncbi:hypothetical protein CERZMDRAFT_83235 [Cercospora zeae-maydis SCOH1-5]|uniref:Uncharacterized protein n=1 Tax=Cercospora zeae-maydis SCOH1-5 TaxID=717836 RepID=A0A6A6FKP5_9PEZI|nr:hypothetical protein CERZMDRAFT_83235 [Cercospora zeae-maydis SCOH1-5]